MRKITLETGSYDKKWSILHLNLENDIISMGFEKLQVQFPIAEWDGIVKGLCDARDNELDNKRSMWKRIKDVYNGRTDNYIESVSNYKEVEKIKDVIKSISDTPKYQLLFASMDIFNFFDILKTEEKYLFAKALIYCGKIRSVTGDGSITVIPEDFSKLPSQIELLDEITSVNKLCRVKFDIDSGEITRYYIPYATTIVGSLSKSASEVWDKIRDWYYQYKWN